jgi:cytochrome o ubiquinol oxidase subunit 3
MTPPSLAIPMPAEDEQDACERKEFGFWLYLMSDAIIFALLFSTYAVMAGNSAGGPTGKDLFSLSRVFVETLILLFSSTTFGLAALAVKAGKKPEVLFCLLVTFALGSAFVALEAMDFSGMIAVGAGPDRSGFLSAFFTLVGTHGLHVSVGLIWIVVMMGQVAIKGLTKPVNARVDRLGLFWHFLDIVWIGIFSVVYLPGVL